MFKLIRRILLVSTAIFFLAAVSFIGFLHTKHILPVLMYHSVSPQKNPGINRLAVTPQTFQAQMRFLKQFKYNVIPLEKAAGLLKDNKGLSGRIVVLTFDDGYKDNYTYAFPILKKYGLPATIFIITDEVGRPDRLSWDEIKEMRDSGLITFGSHCLGPKPLIDIQSAGEINRQISGSKKIIEEKLGCPVTMFSYPEGRFNDKIKQMVIDAGYQLAVTTTPGNKYSRQDVFLIKRLRISENAKNLVVFWFKASGFYSFFRENRQRYK